MLPKCLIQNANASHVKVTLMKFLIEINLERNIIAI